MKKVVLITGASAGIGKESAKLLLQQGYTVYGAARRVDKMNDIESLGAKVLAMNVTDEASMTEGIAAIIKNEGRIDALVNNAGFGSYGAIEEVPITDARYQLEVNLFGTARLTQLVLPHMRKQHFGRIVNISSIGGKLALPLGGWYHASKFALEGLSDSLRNEVRQFGIDVVVIEPGGVKSEWSGIMADNLLKISGNGVYKTMVSKYLEQGEAVEKKVSDPMVIAKLVLKAIEDKTPATRYSGGYLAAPLLFLKKILPDRVFDGIFMSRLNNANR